VILLLPTWLALFATVLGLGLLVMAAGRSLRFVLVVPRIWPTFWLGFSVALALLPLVSLVGPVAGGAAAFLGALATLGWAIGHRLVVHNLVREIRRPRAGLYALAVALTPPLIAYSASRPVTWFDSVTTHLSQVRWISDYGAVPGLANLYPKLGFDSAFHTFAALVNHGPWRDRAAHVAVSFVFCMLLLHWAAVVLLDGSLRARLYALVRHVSA